MKKLLTSILVLLITFAAQAQLHGNKWRFGVSAGVTNYVGDIRPFSVSNFENFTKLYKRYETYSEQLSYQASLEYALGNSVGLMLTAGSYQFGSADRFVKNDGTLYPAGPNFDRALNFQTDLYDAGLSFVFKPDNNWLLSGKSFFAPYLTLGLGVQTFSVSGDLLDADGTRYNYKNQNTIPDGSFETKLHTLNTENPDGYDRTTLYANLGLGVRFRITKSLELFAQTDFKRANTDYLDDVSGTYRTSYDNSFQQYAAKPGTNLVTNKNPNRGNPNSKGDWYIYHGMGIKFSFGANKEAFRPPVITQRYTYVPNELAQNQVKVKEPASHTPTQTTKPTQTINNYITVIQLPKNESLKSSKPKIDSAFQVRKQELIDSLRLREEVLNIEFKQAENELDSINQAITLAESDTTASDSIQATRLDVIEEEKSLAQEKLTSLSSLKSENRFKLDSLLQVPDQLMDMDSTIDSSAVVQELIVYPGQVSRILYSANSKNVLPSDITNTGTTLIQTSESSPETMIQREFETEMAEFRSEMLQAQAKRDSALIMALANRSLRVEEEEDLEPITTVVQADPQEISITQQEVDDKTFRKIQRNQEKSINRLENLEEKNNRLLRDALLIGGTAAATTAITNDRKDKTTSADTALVAKVQEPIATDSINLPKTNVIPVPVPGPTEPVIRIDTVFVENEKSASPRQAKIEVYFEINKTTLSKSEIAKLDPLKNLIERNPQEYLELTGFADNTGSIAYNLKLTEKRVESVKKILMEQYQIPEEKIKAGDGGLIVRGRNSGSKEKDRKVEINLINE